jgi:hypothetical protein
LRAAMELTDCRVILILLAMQRLENGEAAHAASVAAMGIRQWGTRTLQSMHDMSILGPPIVTTGRRGTVTYRIIAGATRCGTVRARTIDPPALRLQLPPIAKRQVRILAQAAAADEVEQCILEWENDVRPAGMAVQRSLEKKDLSWSRTWHAAGRCPGARSSLDRHTWTCLRCYIAGSLSAHWHRHWCSSLWALHGGMDSGHAPRRCSPALIQRSSSCGGGRRTPYGCQIPYVSAASWGMLILGGAAPAMAPPLLEGTTTIRWIGPLASARQIS